MATAWPSSDDAGRGSTRRPAWRVWLPAAVLLAVAGVQIVLVRTASLTPWKGGGFGMFAAVDGGAVRSVRIVIEHAGGRETLEVPPSLVVDAERAAAFPVRSLLVRLATGVVARERRQGRTVERVIVEAWSATLSGDGAQANRHRLAVYVHEVDRVAGR